MEAFSIKIICKNSKNILISTQYSDPSSKSKIFEKYLKNILTKAKQEITNLNYCQLIVLNDFIIIVLNDFIANCLKWLIYIYMVFTTEGLLEVAIESWPEWDLNPRPLHTYTHISFHDELAWPYTFEATDHLF